MAAKGRPAADEELGGESEDWQQPSDVISLLAAAAAATTTTTTTAATTTLTTTAATTTTLGQQAGRPTGAAATATLDEAQAELVDKLEEEQLGAEETIRHLRRQLELRDRELQTLRSELERYKLALRQQRHDNKTAQDNDFVQDHLTTTTTTTRGKLTSPSSNSSRFKNDNISLVKQELDDDIIQEVAQIDLDQLSLDADGDDDDHLRQGKVALERKDSKAPKSSNAKKVIEDDAMKLKGDREEEEEGGSEEDGLLLTSLTDAAISNLSQLAALQERCESQKQQHSTSKSPHSSNKKQEKSLATSTTTTSKQAGNKHKSTATNSPLMAHSDRLATPGPSPVSPTGLSHDADNDDDDDDDDDDDGIGDSAVGDIDDDPYSLANQAALAISAANRHQHLSESISPHNLNQTQSLASVVAAAAVAAAAANDHHQHLLQHHQQRTSPHPTRLIPSAMASPDFYHPLHQHQSASSLPYSPSTSAITTPSPTSLMSAHQQQQRRSISNASSNLVMSAMASPSFLGRHFITDGHIPMMSPSPTSLTTGSHSVSAASSSLAQLLQHHHHHHHHHPAHPHLQQSSHHNHPQQRSASALGVVGPLSSVVAAAAATASSASASPPGTGSAAVSPLMSNKNSTQARLNNMQIRHKFGYLGSGRAQFNSPHGFCLGLNQEIVVADTNNHRICIFDKSGTYITQFGQPGKEEGQLWNPRKVAILHKPSILIQYYKQLEEKAKEAAREAARKAAREAAEEAAKEAGASGEGGSGNNGIATTSTTSTTTTTTTTTTASNNSNNINNSNSSSSSSSTDQANQPQNITTHHHYQQHPCPSHHLSQHTNLHNHQNNSLQQAVAAAKINQVVGINEPLFVVCDRGAERSRMQLFTKDGAFIKKISIHFIDIVAGLAITQNGLIIVVDSVSPTVYIINGETGVLNGWFDCSGHMKEPSDIAVKSDVPRNEYFICDFKGHCVVVFSESGEYLRKIGHDGLTSYPNGIDISDDGDILVGDSHGNRFHVVVFDRNGNFVSQFECPHVKVSRCCGLKITREGYIVTLAKNNHHVLVLDTIHI